MAYKLNMNNLLHKFDFYENVGYRKGWYRRIYKEDFRKLTDTELETKCLGFLYCGTDELQLVKEIIKEINELGI